MQDLQTSLCYIESGSRYLMMHRIKKENDLNHDKWVGIGGKFLTGETPEECMRTVFSLLRDLEKQYSYIIIEDFSQKPHQQLLQKF